MIIQRCKLDAAKLQQVPEKERALFILLGHFVNEVNILNKTFMLCTQFEEQPAWRGHAHSSQALVFARLLVGKLFEGWQLFHKLYFKPPISTQYDAGLPAEAKEALNNLKQYFGRSNIIKTIRNQFSFHYSPRQVHAGLDSNTVADEVVMYLGQTNGNSLYYFSEYVVNVALLRTISDDSAQALDRLIDETSRVVAWLNDLAQGVMGIVVEKYLLGKDGRLTLVPIDIGPIPTAASIDIPFFFDVTASDGDAPLRSGGSNSE